MKTTGLVTLHFSWLLLLFLGVGWWLLWWLLPVVLSMEAGRFSRGPDQALTAEISGIKMRNCKLVIGTHRAFVEYEDGVVRAARFEFLRDKGGPSRSRSQGRQSFGKWRWVPPSDRQDTPLRVLLQVEHLCGDRFRSTLIGPFSVS